MMKNEFPSEKTAMPTTPVLRQLSESTIPGVTDQATICAVVVTFNRLDTIQICLKALRSQTRVPDHILVVDNASTDGSSDFLANLAAVTPDLSSLQLTDNLGPGGGFQAGVEWAANCGFDLLWLMDDDCIPQADCLEMLLAELDGSRDKIVIPRNIDLSRSLSSHAVGWSGVLLSREIVETVGLPNGDLFWWIEDTEYLRYRIQVKHGFGRINSDKAVVSHTHHKSKNKPAWKYYYEVRNKIFYRTWIWKRRRMIVAKDVAKLWARVLLVEEEKLKKSRFIILGVYHGIRGRIGKTFDPATS